jgi:hypothetical protein
MMFVAYLMGCILDFVLRVVAFRTVTQRPVKQYYIVTEVSR